MKWTRPMRSSGDQAPRFHATGAVLSGPAEEPREQVDLAGLQQ